MPACDGQTDGRTDRRTDVKPIAITCFSIADARKNTILQLYPDRIYTLSVPNDQIYSLNFGCLNSKQVSALFLSLLYPHSTHQLQVRCRPGKVRRSETDVLPLSNATSHVIRSKKLVDCTIFSLELFLLNNNDIYRCIRGHFE